MKKGLIGILSLMLVATLTGCSGGAPVADGDDADAKKMEAPAVDAAAEGSGTVAEEAAEEATEAAAEAVVETVAEAAEAAESAEEMKEEATTEAAEDAAVVDGLVGTKWTHKGIELTFKEGNKVHLKGGPVAALSPDGVEADYTLEGDKIEVSVMGESHSGTFTDGKLVVDGEEAKMQ